MFDTYVSLLEFYEEISYCIKERVSKWDRNDIIKL